MSRLSCTHRKTMISAMALLLFGMAAGRAADETPGVARILAVEGTVEMRRDGEQNWTPARRNQELAAGDVVWVHALSRAAVRLRNETVIRLDQNTSISLADPEDESNLLLDLLRGAVYFFSRTPRSVDFKTPFVNGTLEGTEFLVQVDDEKTLVAVFEGAVLARNATGSLSIQQGEAAIATAGAAPQPHELVRSDEAVAWALHYPAIVDLADSTTLAGMPEGIGQAARLQAEVKPPGAIAALDAVSAV